MALQRPKNRFQPHVCLIMPCKGAEPGLAGNIEAALTQQYENYETIIVTDTIDDPAYSIATSVIDKHRGSAAKICTAEPTEGNSGKVAALLTTLSQADPQTEVYAFIDSDAFVPARWLRAIVDPLSDESIGATTGFRWYLPIATSESTGWTSSNFGVHSSESRRCGKWS